MQRGCMGCLTPIRIHSGLWDYARTRSAASVPSEATSMMPDAPRAPVPAARSRTSGTSSCSRASCRRSRCRSPCSLATRSAPRGTIGWSAPTESRSTSTLPAGTTPRPTCRRSPWRRVRCPSARPPVRPPARLPARPSAPCAAIADPPRLGRREAGWNNLQAVDTLVRKSGWRGAVDDGLRRSIALTRYQSTHRTLSYDEYRQLPSVLAAR